MLAVFYGAGIPIRFFWRNKNRNYHWFKKYHIAVFVIIALHYAHLGWMIIILQDFGTPVRDAIHQAVFVGEEIVISILLLVFLKPLKIPSSLDYSYLEERELYLQKRYAIQYWCWREQIIIVVV